MRRDKDFDKYEALSLAERLLHQAHIEKHPKVTAFDIIVNTLRSKMQVSEEQFKAYYLALLAEKEYAGILDSITKVDSSSRKSLSLLNPNRFHHLLAHLRVPVPLVGIVAVQVIEWLNVFVFALQKVAIPLAGSLMIAIINLPPLALMPKRSKLQYGMSSLCLLPLFLVQLYVPD